jgi:D-xylonolactonase
LHVRLGNPPQTLQTYEVPYPNDIAVDQDGGIYVTASGIFDPEAPVCGEIYYIDAKGTMSRSARDIHYSNGIALSQDATQLNVSEHLKNRVRTYRIGKPGDLANDYTATNLTAYAAHPKSADDALLGPDGLGIDAKGHLWVAHYAGGRLLRLGSDGRTEGSVSFAPPFVNVTNVTNHPDGRLFVTVVSDDAHADHPGAVVSLAPTTWERAHMHCTIVPPQVTCVPTNAPQER